jgi:hypothetical protein
MQHFLENAKSKSSLGSVLLLKKSFLWTKKYNGGRSRILNAQKRHLDHLMDFFSQKFR